MSRVTRLLDNQGGAISALLAGLERRVGITPVGVAVLGVAASAFVLGRATGRAAVDVLVYALLGLLGFAAVAGRRRIGLDAARSSLPARARVGQRLQVELDVTAKRRISTIVLEEELPTSAARPVRVPVAALSSGEPLQHSYRVDLAERGVYKVGPLVAEWTDPFGLTRRRSVIAEATEIIVHPRTEAVLDRISSRQWEDPPVRPPRSKAWPTGFEFYGMRDYVNGDDPRRLVWRATARTGRYLVRESEQGITDRVNLILDNDRMLYGPDRPNARFETAVRIAASVGAQHLKDGFTVSVDVNDGPLAKSLRGPTARTKLLDPLAVVDTSKTELDAALDRLLVNPHRNAHNVVISPEVSARAATRLRILIERGVAVVVVLVLGEEEAPNPSLHRVGALGCSVVEVRPGASIDRAFQQILGLTRR